MAQGGQPRYVELKDHLSAPARRVIVELIDFSHAPEDVLCRVAREDLHSEAAAYAYVREVLYRSLIEVTEADISLPLDHAHAPALPAPGPVAAG